MASHSVCLLNTRQKGQASVNIRRSPFDVFKNQAEPLQAPKEGAYVPMSADCGVYAELGEKLCRHIAGIALEPISRRF
jgi:hypothetical protein